MNWDETWSWNGSGWSQVQPLISPPARSRHAMVMDSVRNRVVLFGGTYGGAYLNDTWEFDGVRWSQVNTATSPPVRFWHAMAYDLARGRSVLFGGAVMLSPGGIMNYWDTWEYDGNNWAAQMPAHSPVARRGARMAYIPGTGRSLLFGGVGPGSILTPLNDTWEWDGVDWSQRLPLVSPDARFDQGMCSDTSSRTWIFGGSDRVGFPLGDTWEWDGGNWVKRLPTNSPAARASASMAFDVISQQPLLYGGNNGFPYTDTQTLSSASPQPASFGAGCAGSAGVPHLSASACWVGQVAQVSVGPVLNGQIVLAFMGLSNVVWSGRPLPYMLNAWGMPGCYLYVAPAFACGLSSGSNGVASASFAIPNTPQLAGVRVFSQWLVLDPGANAAGAVVSDAVILYLASP